MFYDWRITSSQGINIYDDQGHHLFTSTPSTVISLQQEGITIDGKTYQQLQTNTISNTQQHYFIDCSQEGIVEDSSWKIERPHLLLSGQSIQTLSHFELKDINGNVKLIGHTPLSFDVVTVDSDKVGVYFQDKLLYIQNDQLETLPLAIDTSTNPNSISVLMYHFFYDPSTETSQDGNDLNINTFDQQLDYLQENGYTTLTMQELYHYVTSSGLVPNNSVVITMDDGDESVYRLAKQVIQDHQFNATLFVIGGWFGENLPFEFIDMSQFGIELQSHSFLMHQGGCPGMGHGGRLLCVDRQEGIDDTIQSLNYVDNGFVYCYPFGDVNDHAIDILQQTDVKMAFTTESGKVKPGDDVYRLPRIRISEGSDMNYFIQSIGN